MISKYSIKSTLKSVVQLAKNKYLSLKYSKCKGDIKKTWKFINTTLGKKSNLGVSHISTPGGCISNGLQIAQEYYSIHTTML